MGGDTGGHDGGAAVATRARRCACRAPLQGTVVLLPVPVGRRGVGRHRRGGARVDEDGARGAQPGGRHRSRYLDVDVGGLVADGTPLAVVEAGEPADGVGRRSTTTSTSTTSAPTWPSCSPGGRCWPTPAGPRWWPGATSRAAGRPGRTSTTCATPASFTEYGGFAIAAQRRRRDLDELIERTPADGLVGGTARVNGDRFDDERARCAVVSYDYTVLAGTQGQQNHRKKDRLFELVERLRLPVVLFAEGGGGRPGDTDYAVITGLDTQAFALFGGSSGLVPLVGIASGWCFAGNAALLGCCDVIIATVGSLDRHGWPGHDRGRRTRHLPARGGRPAGRAGAERRGRPGGGRRRRGGGPGPAVPVLLPGSGRRLDAAPTSACCAPPCPSSACGPTTSGPCSTSWPTPARCSSCGGASAPGW